MADRQSFPVGDSDHGQLIQNNTPLTTIQATPLWVAFLSLTVSTSVVGLGTARGSYSKAYISVESNPVRYTVDGTLPTASVGHLLSVGDVLELDTESEVREFQTIRQSSADATLMITFGLAK